MKKENKHLLFFLFFFILSILIIKWLINNGMSIFEKIVGCGCGNKESKIMKKMENFDINETTDFMDGVDMIYYINLDRSLERRKNMEKLLSDSVFNNIEKVRFSAIDGKKENAKNSIKTANTLFRPLSGVEYACLLSHLKTITLFSDSDVKNQVALIFEDDVTLEFKKYWKKSVKQIMKEAPANWEIIQLCFIGQGKDCLIVPKVDYDNKVYPSAAAYLINRKGAERIKKLYSNGKYNVESSAYPIADLFIFGYCKTYTCKYPMFIYSGDDSTLHDEDLKCHMKTKKIVKDMYASMYD